MAGLRAPLSTLRPAPRDALRMTRGPAWLAMSLLLRTFTFLLSAQSPGALPYFNFRFVCGPHLSLEFREGEYSQDRRLPLLETE
jgi:hypothetical protein